MPLNIPILLQLADCKKVLLAGSGGGFEVMDAACKFFADNLQLDAIILLDGGVDALMRGDEERPSSILEDRLTLTAIERLNVPVKRRVRKSIAGFDNSARSHLQEKHLMD